MLTGVMRVVEAGGVEVGAGHPHRVQDPELLLELLVVRLPPLEAPLVRAVASRERALVGLEHDHRVRP